MIVPLGTPDRIQESWGTTLRHTSRRPLARVNKGRTRRTSGGWLVPGHSQCDPSRPSPSNSPHTASARSYNSGRLSCHLLEPASLQANHQPRDDPSVNRNGRRTRQPELGMCFDGGHHASEHVCRNHMNLVQEYETPFSRRQKLHHLLRFIGPVMSVRDHRIRGDNDPAFTRELHVMSNRVGSITPRRADRRPPYAPSLSDRL